jgi:hypothetical protein
MNVSIPRSDRSFSLLGAMKVVPLGVRLRGPETFRFIQVDIEPDAIIHGGDPARRDVRVGVVGR